MIKLFNDWNLAVLSHNYDCTPTYSTLNGAISFSILCVGCGPLHTGNSVKLLGQNCWLLQYNQTLLKCMFLKYMHITFILKPSALLSLVLDIHCISIYKKLEYLKYYCRRNLGVFQATKTRRFLAKRVCWQICI